MANPNITAVTSIHFQNGGWSLNSVSTGTAILLTVSAEYSIKITSLLHLVYLQGSAFQQTQQSRLLIIQFIWWKQILCQHLVGHQIMTFICLHHGKHLMMLNKE